MRREGTDENSVQMSDVLCDFCHAQWTLDRPMVEGHRGSVICGPCTTLAYRALVLTKDPPPAPPESSCVMCLQPIKPVTPVTPVTGPAWSNPLFPLVFICPPCTRQAAGVLSKDKESGWSRPTV